MGDSPKQRVAHRVAFRHNEPLCDVCGVTNSDHKEDVGLQLDAHHVDGDSENNSPDNLILVCRSCHRGIHRNKAEQFTEYYEKLPEDKQWGEAKEWKTMRVPTDSWTLAKEAKDESGMTWGEWLEAPIHNDTDDADGGSDEPTEQIDIDIGRVQLDAQEYRKIADELETRLR